MGVACDSSLSAPPPAIAKSAASAMALRLLIVVALFLDAETRASNLHLGKPRVRCL